MNQLGNALKAAEKERAAEREAGSAKKADWGKERDCKPGEGRTRDHC